MKKSVLVLPLLCAAAVAFTQKDTLIKEKNLDEVIIYANKFAEKRKNIAQKVEVISARFIAQSNAQNTGDLLVNTGNVFVQKSQQGGSSPVLRGFEASRVLLVVDGIRMNNAIYRAGHLQNVITVDQNMLERVEVLYGPASTIYGSDALGGVIHMRTKTPKLSSDKKFLSVHNVFGRYSSANEEKTVHYDISLGGKKFAWLQAYNYSYFSDMKMGKNYADKYPDFGRRSQYVTNINGIDSVINNPDDRVQKFSGYKQWDITQKILYKPKDNISHLLNVQFSNSGDVPRYDRLQDIRNGTLRYAEWFYGPQKRLLAAYEFALSQLGFLDEIKTIISLQDIEESRQTRDYRGYDRFDSRIENLKVWGFNIDGRKRWSKNELTTGIDGQVNDLESSATRTNKITGAVSTLDSRYPNGENRMNYFALYAQHLLKLSGGKIVLNDGIRFQVVNLHSDITDNSFFNLPFTEIDHQNFALTGNVGMICMPLEDFRVTLNLASGFRAPNIDDLARIFESSTSTKRVVFPNPDIKPEYTYNIDLGLSHLIAAKIKFEITGFYTWFRNAIVIAPFRLNGQDSVMYNGTLSAVFANQNKNKAFIYGFNANINYDLTAYFSFLSTVTYTFGRFKQDDGSNSPLDHIPPVYGKTSLNYNRKKYNIELYAMYNGWKRIRDYNSTGEDNIQYATPDGMPCWFTLNFKTSWNANRYLTLQAGVENVFDSNYRYFASGFSAPGRNFIFALRSNL